jgi:DNA invertase Pin-like site-specific DNA recombinase
MSKKREVREHPKVAVTYVRVSTKDQVDNLSLGLQRERCKDWCVQRGIDVIAVFDDPGQSARTVRREAFQRMLAFIRRKKGAVGYVVVHDLSRFARNMDAQIEVIASLHSEGVLLRSVMEDVDETAAGKMVTNMHGLINQFFSDRNAERTRLGMEKAAKEGRFPFKAPLGYLNVRRVKDGPNLIPDPERAPLISKAFDLYAAGNLSRAELLRKLTNLGLTSANGKRLTPQSLENVLRNPAYSGRVVIADWGINERGSFDPLVSSETFQRVQDIMDGKNRAVIPHVRNNEDFPLRVFVRCAMCREPLTASWSKGRSRRYAYYRCRNRKCLAVKVSKDTHASTIRKASSPTGKK